MEGPTAHSGSSEARGIANRRGVGKLRHLQVGNLWLQQARVGGQVKDDRVDTLPNTADLGTKFFGRGTTEAVDWNAARLERVVHGRSAKEVWRS